jgi:hypothetical protein
MMSMDILLGSVMGGIMAMFTLERNNLFLLAIGLAVTMANLVLSIGQAPAKWLVRGLVTCVIVNTLIIIISLLTS